MITNISAIRSEPSVFLPALEELKKSGRRWTEPQTLKSYLGRNGVHLRRKTAEVLSVQSWSTLDQALRDSGVMVFRLGESGRDGARFALAAAVSSLSREFFFEDETFLDIPEALFIPDASARDLYPYQLLGKLNEDGAVDLAIASGMLGEVLALDRPFPRVAPARTSSKFTFEVRPHPAYADCAWTHTAGQVEVDGTFLARREGKWKIFVLEAKSGFPSEQTRLPKYKLMYAVSVISKKRIPTDMEIVPVYLRSWQDSDRSHVHYAITECEMLGREVAQLTPRRTKRILMPFGGIPDGRLNDED